MFGKKENTKTKTKKKGTIKNEEEEVIISNNTNDVVEPEKVDETQDEEVEMSAEDIVDEYNSLTTEINDSLSNIYDEKQLVETATDKLEKLDSIEEMVDKKMEQLKNNDIVKKQLNRDFGGFWNGVSSGWEY